MTLLSDEMEAPRQITVTLPRVELHLDPEIVAGVIGGLVALGVFSPLAYMAINNILTYAKEILNG
jgi:hypothetical protein